MTIAGEVRLGDQVGAESENELITRARRGDPVAWGILVCSHQEHVFRLAYLVLYDSAEAEDVAQEAFMRAFLTLDRFETGRPLQPWLTRITINLARNRRRALGRYLNHLRRLLTNEPEPELSLAFEQEKDIEDFGVFWTPKSCDNCASYRKISPILANVPFRFQY